MSKRLLKCLIAVCIMLAPNVTLADEVALPKGFFALEGAGLLKSQKDGGLGDGVWNGSSRAHISALIKALPTSSESYSVQSLIDAILLGQSNTKALEGAQEVTLGRDLLTLRLEKLSQSGRYDKALELYSAAVDETPYHPKLAKAGIIAMLGSGEKSLACVDSKIYDNGEVDTAFWDDLRAYCEHTLSDSPSDASSEILENSSREVLRAAAFNPDFEFNYSNSAYKALSPLERVALIAEQAIKAPNLSAETVKDMHPAHVSALLAQEHIQGDVKIRLFIRAAQLGIIDVAALTRAYKTHEDAQSPLPALYTAFLKASDDAQKIEILQKAIALKAEYGIAGLLPFGVFFEDFALPSANLDDIGVILQLMHRLDLKISSKFVADLIENYGSDDDISKNYIHFYKIKSVYSGSQSDELSKIVQKNSLSVKSPRFFIINVIENLDKNSPDVDNAAIVYEKDFELTTQTQHVMPSYALWNRLNSVANEKLLGETVLLSAFVLHDQNMGSVYPKLFRDIINNFDRVRLTPISKRLAIEALLAEM